MAGAAAGGLVAVTLGTLVGSHPVLSVALVTLAATLCAFGQAFPPAGPAVGNTIALHLIIATFLPSGPDSLFPALAGYAGGAAWALFLGLVVWPVRIYKPLRRAVSAALTALADYTTSLSVRAYRDELTHSHRVIRDQLEAARRTLVSTRRGRSSETGRGERLLGIVHAADHMFGVLLAIEEVLDAGLPSDSTAELMRGLEAHAGSLRALADAVLHEHPPPLPPPAFDPATDIRGDGATTQHARLLLERVYTERARCVALVASLATESEPALGIVVESDALPSFLDVLRANFDLDSAVLRHALRVAICVLLASTIASLYVLDHGYWIALTTFLLLQPNRSATTTRAVQRGVGTVIGAVFAAAVTFVIRDPLPMTLVIVVLAGLSASVLQLNYALFSLFVTPTFVLLAEVHTHDIRLIEIRILYTLLAGAIAFLASWLLWPHREHIQFDEQMARALEALERYLGAVSAAVAADAPSPAPDVIATRRTFGLAVNNAETALDRAVADRSPAELIEPRMTMVTMTRRLGGAINVYGSTRNVVEVARHQPALAAFSSAIRTQLATLIGALRSGQPPPPWRPEVPEFTDATIAARRLRIERYMVLVGEAVTRATTPTARAPADLAS